MLAAQAAAENRSNATKMLFYYTRFFYKLTKFLVKFNKAPIRRSREDFLRRPVTDGLTSRLSRVHNERITADVRYFVLSASAPFRY